MDKSTFSKINFWLHKHPVFSNFLLIIVTSLVVVWLINIFLKRWTHHDDTLEVAYVIGLSVDDARQQLESIGYEVELDSIYNPGVAPGIVVDQSPREHSIVKKGRTIYLRYARYSSPNLMVPNYYNMDSELAVLAFVNAGFEDVSTQEVITDTPGLVVSASYNGLLLTPGKEIPSDAHIIIKVGVADPSAPDAHGGWTEELILPDGTTAPSNDGTDGNSNSTDYDDDPDFFG